MKALNVTVILAGALAVPSSAQATAEAPDDLVLSGIYKPSVEVKLSNGSVRGLASYSSRGKKVYVAWYYKVAGLNDGPLIADSTEYVSRQEIALAFWPTEVTACAVDKIAVAGRTIRGKTKVQVLEFEPVEALSVFYDMNGKKKIPKLSVPLRSIDTVFLEEADTVGDISLMMPNLGLPGSIFVQFIGVGEFNIYHLDLDSGGYAKVVTPTDEGAGDALVVPELTGFLNVRAIRHLTLGNMYRFSNPGHGGTQTELSPILVLLDEDNDGLIDSHRLLVVAEDWTDEYADADNYETGTLVR